MRIINKFSENFILPLSDIASGKSISKHLKFLQKSQWWSESNLAEYQNEKLRALIKHAYENVPYYTELFKKLNLTPADIYTTADLHKLPILTKKTIRENFKNGKIIAKNIPKNQMILGCSSGSTGEPLQYYITKDTESFLRACGIRGWFWIGYRLGDKYIKISQYDRPVLKRIQDLINRSKFVPAKQLTEEYFDNIVNEINKFHPKIIRSFPDQMLFLAKYIKKDNINIFSPTAITTTGSTLHKTTRYLIEKQFDCRIFDSYSCEGGANVSECETHNCYHSSMEYAITEIISNNEEVNEGEKGRLITTDLINYAVPFIRYDTQDYVTKSKERCSCGRNLLAIEKIDGRDSDILITPGGKYLIVHIFNIFFESIDSVDQFQVRQDKINKINILLKVNEKYTKEEEKKTYNYWEKYIGEDVKIKISVVNDIPLAKSGKRRFLIRNKDIKLDM